MINGLMYASSSSIRVANGKYFDFNAPDPELITIENIARPLSRICRFGGHTPRFYSVAEHSSLAAQAATASGCSDEESLAILLHDAAEAFCGDVVKPLKNIIGRAYADVESRVEQAVGLAFGVDFEKHSDIIKKFDMAMLMAELRFFFGDDSFIWDGEKTAKFIFPVFQQWTPTEAEMQFVDHLQCMIVASTGRSYRE